MSDAELKLFQRIIIAFTVALREFQSLGPLPKTEQIIEELEKDLASLNGLIKEKACAQTS